MDKQKEGISEKNLEVANNVVNELQGKVNQYFGISSNLLHNNSKVENNKVSSTLDLKYPYGNSINLAEVKAVKDNEKINITIIANMDNLISQGYSREPLLVSKKMLRGETAEKILANLRPTDSVKNNPNIKSLEFIIRSNNIEPHPFEIHYKPPI